MSLPQCIDIEPYINGNSAAVILEFVDKTDGETPYPLTGWTFRLTVKYNRFQSDDEAIFKKSVVADNQSVIIFSLSPEETNPLIQAAYDYDVQATSKTGEACYTPIMGKMRVKRGVTERLTNGD